MSGRARKRLPWTYYESLGWGGKRVDEERARSIVRRVGLDAASDLGDTPLTVASVLGRVGMVRWLLEQGADVEDVAPHRYFKPALCAAAYGKSPEVAALLIAAGANLEAPDRFGNTPLANAFINCFTDPLPLAALLIEHGAELTDRVRELGESWNAAAFHAFLAGVAKHSEPGAAADPAAGAVSRVDDAERPGR
jgi:ankyrin repeat protein